MAKRGPKSSDPVDRHVGSRVRLRRRALGMSQAVLAERLGLTFQQIQKYERGTNRISASRLYRIAAALETGVPEFFEGLPAPKDGGGAQEDGIQRALDRLVDTTEGAAMAELFPRVASLRTQRAVLGLVRTLADADLAEEACS
jgi:transcriptional regulator with XRE-family HTH domain